MTLSLVFRDKGAANLEVLLEMAKNLAEIIPGVLIIMGVFSVWISSDMVEKHLGPDSGYKGMFASFGFGVVSTIPIFMAFPMGHMLYNRKARLANIYIFFGALAVPFTALLVEAQFMGVKWTAIRFALTIPMIIICSHLGELWYSHTRFGKPIPGAVEI